jgi:hypothetical protein
MDNQDAAAFVEWRIRRMRLAIGILIGLNALSLCLAAVALAMGVRAYRHDQDARIALPTAVPTARDKGQSRDAPALAAALRAAAERMEKVELPVGADAWKTDEYRLAKPRQLYRDALAAGVPVLCLRGCKEITQRVAAELEPAAREAWLRAALRAATKPRIHSSVLAEVEEALGEKHVGAYLYTGAECVWEAVYNLSGDAALRLEARGLWEAWATKQYVEDMSIWERCRADPMCIPGPQPVRPEMPEWGRPGG